MTQTPVNLRLWSEVKEFLKTENEKLKEKSGGPPKLGAFALFSAIQPKNPCDEVYPGIVLGNAYVDCILNYNCCLFNCSFIIE